MACYIFSPCSTIEPVFLTTNVRGEIMSAPISPREIDSWTSSFWKIEKPKPAHAYVQLGFMCEGNYDCFIKKMNEIAAKAGIVNPKLAIGLELQERGTLLNPPGPLIKKEVFHVTKEEWSTLEKNKDVMYNALPRVFVVDGSRYVLPKLDFRDLPILMRY